ncbi:MAG: NAD-glutamate dehydrogenase [Alphaproteobacteria bacterium]
MGIKSQELKAELLGKVVTHAKDKLTAERADEVEAMVAQVYANVPPGDLISRERDEVYSVALSLWQYAEQRQPGTVKLRAFNPNVADDGWHSGHTVVQIINDDMPFLVDSVVSEIDRHDLTVHLIIHPVLNIQRDQDGKCTHLHRDRANGHAPDGYYRESCMHIEIDQLTDPDALAELEAGLNRVLGDVRLIVDDWKPMLARVAESVEMVKDYTSFTSGQEASEASTFLKWLHDNHFTLLGSRDYRFEEENGKARMRVVDGSGLGLCRDNDFQIFDGLRNLDGMPERIQYHVRDASLLVVTKSNRVSTVHRPVQMDAVAVKRYDKDGNVTGERLFIGLFTSVAYSRSARDIPFLTGKVDRVLRASGMVPNSHDGKALTHILDTYPRDELFQISDEELLETALGILHLQDRHHIACFFRRDAFDRFISVMIFVPRDRYDTRLRRTMQDILEHDLNGTTANFTTAISDAPLARVHFLIQTKPGAVPDFDESTIEAKLQDAGRSWGDRLRAALKDDRGEEAALKVLRRYGEAFPPGYTARVDAHTAIYDIEKIEELATAETDLTLNLYRPVDAEAGQVNFKIYHADTPVPLSDVMPMMGFMGLKVNAEVPYEVLPVDCDRPVFLHDFLANVPEGIPPLSEVKDNFHDAFSHIWSGDAENDEFNELVLGANLSWREVVILRATAKYLRQVRIAFSLEAMAATLAAHPRIARRMVRLFHAMHDPAFEGDREQVIEDTNGEITEMLDEVENVDDDTILRRCINFINCVLRTNYYQPDEKGEQKSYISFKLNCCKLMDLPKPAPYREIFVYSPRVEGVHLRGGTISRGGLRWSDRREDFRTEILGLMKAQMVKNSVIVPVGAKGGFVMKQPPVGDRDAWFAEGVACYKTFIRGLLDITDNIVKGEIVPPRDVVRRDDDDPYLVVAADKGTATFSDTANGVAAEYGFWLGDAFASGGSAGYDHKGMGITARGAWESVKRHFREIGVDCQTEPFTCIGVGDMAGDVFGNGMLLSTQTKLLAAFNHMHIFVDPDPDPATSFAERKRLFEMKGSTWADYSEDLLSKGGMIFERKSKLLKPTQEIRDMLGMEETTITPAELIRALLKHNADLLWFGGIGTYIKSRRESNADVGDKANDALRVNAREVRARIIGEGANLGVTQDGRIEFAMTGGRINTDFIDNSAGVDTSDHEVNIKILLKDAIEKGRLTEEKRNPLLVEMTDEVGQLVLEDNYRQSEAISIARYRAPELLGQHLRFIKEMEVEGLLDRAVEGLPDDEGFAERARRGEGLTRPELSVLLCYAKIDLYNRLLATDLPRDPALTDGVLQRYFPTALQEQMADLMPDHRLAGEIVTTQLANGIINRMGIGFVSEMREKTGMGADAVARAFVIARRAFGLLDLWAEIDSLDNKVSATAQTRMQIKVIELVTRSVHWIMMNGAHPLKIDDEAVKLTATADQLRDQLDDLLTPGARSRAEKRARRLTDGGVPKDLAWRFAKLPLMASACDLTRIAEVTESEVADVASLYFRLGDKFKFQWLRDQAQGMELDDHWGQQALEAQVSELFSHQSDLTRKVLRSCPKELKSSNAMDWWVDARQHKVTRALALLTELKAQPTLTLPMITVASRQLRDMAR